MSKAVLWLGASLVALYVGGAAAESNTFVAADALQPAAASRSTAPSNVPQAQIKVPTASLRYMQALQLVFYHDVYRRCNQQNSPSPLYSATVDALRTVTSLGEKNRLTDLLYNEMAGNALGMAMASDPDRQRCAVAGNIYQQLLNSDAPGVLQQVFRLQLPADEPPHA
ncbi:acetyl-CoA carboxylase [Edwardsiella ictaluri]|uniref:Acetyl-CoA carboxylase n=1 Tax=Edwardsiella ictaluri TaxID=67780 RepID=A0ABY8GG73_EDWIC|nr:hypothetical protein [Edwardsiella ictaluri]ELV7528527.1 acetyl-CoA carboxylase [Edwardsiella ictaluri]KMQ77848.1 acetyl-CoA carboxylase [Edwardsiella ictaluri]KOO54716.1 acetyl-CoA carboxylase [Edwardsiella ictaluri]WFN96519.1 acetyl-CoA carboxylase [Edwardsiella ictaluri]